MNTQVEKELSPLNEDKCVIIFSIISCDASSASGNVPSTRSDRLNKLGGRLDKQHDEIVKALSDINAFNAGKKRDKALALLSAWLPDMEKFSREIQKQSDYIDSLKQMVGVFLRLTGPLLQTVDIIALLFNLP